MNNETTIFSAATAATVATAATNKATRAADPVAVKAATAMQGNGQAEKIKRRGKGFEITSEERSQIFNLNLQGFKVDEMRLKQEDQDQAYIQY